MIDYISIRLKDYNWNIIRNNPLLEFQSKVFLDTGETTSYQWATYNGLVFKIIDETIKRDSKLVTIKGSIHKYFNKGFHNYNNFTYSDFVGVLNELDSLFGIKPQNAVLRSLEFGVNLNTSINISTILDSLIMRGTKPFHKYIDSDYGDVRQVIKQRSILKIYNKSKQYKNKGFNIENDILRIEKKYLKMYELNKRDIYTLRDLNKDNLSLLYDSLTTEWSNLLISDSNALKGSKNEFKYNNSIYWSNLNYSNFKYHRNNLNTILSNHPNNIKNEVFKSLKKKKEILLN